MISAPIYSQINDDRSQAELAAWARFASPKDTSEFCASWLAILCPQIERVSGALLVLGPDKNGAYSAASVWPDVSRDMQYLSTTAEKALKERKGIVDKVLRDRRGVVEQVKIDRRKSNPNDSSIPRSAFIGYPIEVSGELHGAVIVDVTNPTEEELQQALRVLHWGSAWLIDQFRQQTIEEYDKSLNRMAVASDLVATTLQEYKFGAATLAVVNELAARLNCDRVSLGFEKSGSIEVQAISNTAKFDKKTDLLIAISDAMDEVLDLDSVIVYPVEEDELGLIAHKQLASELNDISICSVPLMDRGVVVGVITLERTAGETFNDHEVEVFKTTGLLLGPILWLKAQNERSFFQRAREAGANAARVIFGPQHPGAKLIALILVSLIVTFSFVDSDYRVTSKAIIEGSMQRAATAPFDGYITEALVRAGDTVKQGEVLFRLDDRDLKLDQIRWLSERQQSERKFRQAIAIQDRTAMAIASAQIEQAQAQLTLAEDKLSRTTVKAPFEGVVVHGDLSQLLGSPVEQGKVLFEIAPLDKYRVILNIDERDISAIQLGQKGSLALSGMPYNIMHFSVKQLTPVSTSQDGKNYFRVEAQLDDASKRLRPGMEGVGKLSVGERKLIWVMTHSLVDWFRLWLWEWTP